jgi:tRNA dimethylallyltransferase
VAWETGGVGAPPLIAVVGATATGKSALGVALARELGGEVINVDSMQLYRGMDIGTAKLTEAERGGVTHHLLDIWDVTEPASVAAYQRLARARIEQLVASDRPAVLVGGSGLYVRAVLDDLQFPGTDPAVRARLEAEAAHAEPGQLHARLAALDAASAAAILPGNTRRIVRALEVLELTGGPFIAALPEPRYVRPAVQLGLRVAPAELDRRIEARVARMWADGLVAEVARLADVGLRDGRTAARALGYAQVLEFLAGRCSEEEARVATALATRRFARRQQKWFARDPRIHWLSAEEDNLPAAALRLLDIGPAAADSRRKRSSAGDTSQ